MTVFNDEHLQDLRKSGLSDETIKAAKFKSVSTDVVFETTGYSPPGLISSYKIPYDSDFSVFRCFYGEGAAGPKYLQKTGAGNRLYIPPAVAAALKDVSVDLYFTEGVKKALKACQEGLCCIGLAGLWNWSNGNKELISDFEKISFNGRSVYIVPDNDYRLPDKEGYPKNLKQAVDELADKLVERGANVFIVELPPGESKGLDDYLVKHPVNDFKSLPCEKFLSLDEKIANAGSSDLQEILERIAEIPLETERDFRINDLAKRMNLSKKFIRKDIEKIAKTKNQHGHESIYTALFPELVDLVVDNDENVGFLVKASEELRVEKLWNQKDETFVPPRRDKIPFELPRASEVLKAHENGTDDKLADDIQHYLERVCYLTAKQRAIATDFAFLSYLQDHPAIFYMPILLFYAVPERGKSRTGKALSYICYRGYHTVDLRQPSIFRFAEYYRMTLFFDVMDLWKKAQKEGAEDILLARPEKGLKVSRVMHPDKGRYEDIDYYEVYGPTIIASNEAMHDILNTRCIPIVMENKPGEYENILPTDGRELKERLTAWRAKNMNCTLPEVELVEGIKGRLWDIAKPLLQACKMASNNDYDILVEALQDVAGYQAEGKKDSAEGKIVQAIVELFPDGVSTHQIMTSTVLEKINHGVIEKYRKTSQGLGRELKRMGIKADRKTGHSRITITREELDVFIDQYGLQEGTDRQKAQESRMKYFGILAEDDDTGDQG